MQAWWDDFFRGPFGKLQAAGYPEERTRSEVDFLVQALGLAPGARVLDVPCGAGRHTIELAARGIASVGVDFNDAALAVARAHAAERKLEIELHAADMRELAWREQFDAAFCYFGSFGYFSDDDNLRCARALCTTLRPSGKLLIDTHVLESVLPRFAERGWAWSGAPGVSARMLEERRWDAESGRMLASWTFLDPSGSLENAQSSIRVYSYRELCSLLREAGFRELQGLETLTGAPFGLGSRRLALIATK